MGNNAEKGIGAYKETSCKRDAGVFKVVAGLDVGKDLEWQEWHTGIVLQEKWRGSRACSIAASTILTIVMVAAASVLNIVATAAGVVTASVLTIIRTTGVLAITMPAAAAVTS